MTADLPQTASKTDGPLVKQFSIFLPNKVGAMLDVVKLLHAHNTHVVALSISESTDSSIARIVVSDPEQVEELFRQHDVPFGVCAMVVVELREVATELAKLLAALLMAEVNVHFSYPLADPSARVRGPRPARGRHRLRLVRSSRRRIQTSEPGGYFPVAFS